MVVKEIECTACGSEYVLTYDESNVVEAPEYCPFCGWADEEEDFDDWTVDDE